MSRNLRIYISGPITGTTDYMERFSKAQSCLEKKGYSVINPALVNSNLPVDFAHADYMKVCMTLMEMADAIYMMDGWKGSKGAQMELDRAETNGLMVLYETKPRKKTGMDYNKWLRHQFSTGCCAGDDYLRFQKEMKADLKKRAAQEGLEIERFDSNHYCFSAVLKNKAGNRAYLSIPDVRWFGNEWYDRVLYRTMAHATDWTGGNNHYTTWPDVCTEASRLIA